MNTSHFIDGYIRLFYMYSSVESYIFVSTIVKIDEQGRPDQVNYVV
jgi:hypothetical protein